MFTIGQILSGSKYHGTLLGSEYVVYIVMSTIVDGFKVDRLNV